MKYIFRSVKYLVKLIVLFAILVLLMMWSGTSSLNFDSLPAFFESFFSGTQAWRGWLFTAVVVVWCAVYPKVEFVTRRLDYDMVNRRGAIIKAMNAGGMILASEGNGRMVFRGESMWRRVWFLGDEVVTITRGGGGGIDVEGPRRFVMEARYRIPMYIDKEQADA